MGQAAQEARDVSKHNTVPQGLAEVFALLAAAGTVPLLSAVLLPLALALGRTARNAAPDVAFGLQKLVYRVAGLVFVGAAVYHAVGAVSVPVPPPDPLLYNEASAAYHVAFSLLNSAFAAGLLLVMPPSTFLARAMAVLALEQVLDHGARAWRIEARGDDPDWGSLPIIVLLPALADYMLHHLSWDKRFRKSRKRSDKFVRGSRGVRSQ